MANYGVQIFDPSGDLILDHNDLASRHVATIRVSNGSGSQSISGINPFNSGFIVMRDHYEGYSFDAAVTRRVDERGILTASERTLDDVEIYDGGVRWRQDGYRGRPFGYILIYRFA